MLEIACVTVDAQDPSRIGRWWAEALGYRVVEESSEECLIVPERGARGWPVLFFVSPDEKAAKNRLHLDLRPDDQAAEVARLESMGARRIDIGQGEQPWVVMADPDGNEFCVLRARE